MLQRRSILKHQLSHRVENSLPQSVEGKDDLAAAVSLDGVGINISRAIGWTFVGLVIGYWGMLDSAIERQTRYVMLVKLSSKDTETVINALVWHTCKLPAELY